MRLNTRYALYLSAALLCGAVFALALAGAVLLRDGDRFRASLQEDLRRNLLLDQQESLSATADYLGRRLFNPLQRLDVDALNREIAEIRAWLPVRGIEIADPAGRLLTDGSVENAAYGRPVEGGRIGVFDLVFPHVYSFPGNDGAPAGVGVAFAVRQAGHTAGFVQLVLDERVLLSSADRLSILLEALWAGALERLVQLGLLAALAACLLALLLSRLLSQRLSAPLLEMIRAAQRFADGDLAHVIRHDARDEIGGLADALNRMARTLWKSGRLLAKAQEMSGVGGWEYEVRDDRFVWSAQAASVLGVAYEALPVTRDALHVYIHPDDLPWVSRLLDADYAGNPVFRHEFRVLRSNGEQRTLRVVGEASLGDDGRLLRMIGAFQDVSEHKQAEAQLVYLASYDTLTGLPNRSLFIDRLAHGLRQADRQQGRLALLFLDLDRFKEINDTLGHAAGDDLLRQAAERLKRVVRETDTVARLGGDEFTVVLEGLPSGEEAAGIAQKILDTLACPFRLGTHEVFVSASIGITVYPGDADGIDSLLKNADRAMYLAKAEGRNTYRYFTVEMNSRAHERLALETALRGALARGEFVLHYQPQVDVRSGDLVGFEALLRWQRGAQRVPPAEFVPVLEDTGLIVEVGAWVIEEACRWLAAWNTTYGVAASVAVNVSGRQFRDSGLLATVSRALRESGIAAAQLELEITESCLVDEARSLDLIHALSGLGVRLAIDDFGTGYSSLAYLKRLPVEKLKIDRSFVHDIGDDHEAAAIVAAILALAHTLQLRVVAEGVETVEQLAYLRHHDCDEIQGYLIAPPLAPSDLAAWRGALTSTLTGHARVVPLRVWRD